MNKYRILILGRNKALPEMIIDAASYQQARHIAVNVFCVDRNKILAVVLL